MRYILSEHCFPAWCMHRTSRMSYALQCPVLSAGASNEAVVILCWDIYRATNKSIYSSNFLELGKTSCTFLKCSPRSGAKCTKNVLLFYNQMELLQSSFVLTPITLNVLYDSQCFYDVEMPAWQWLSHQPTVLT